MNFIKRHKFKLILLFVFVVVFVVALIALMNLLYPDSRKNVYGNRLEGIEDVPIKTKILTEIKDKISASDFVLEVDDLLTGRLVKFTIYVKSDTNKEEAKKVVANITETFSQEIQEFYDIQVVIDEDKEDSTAYPIFAYKHKTSKDFIWTKN